MKARSSSFLILWTSAVLASTAAFCVYLTLRVRAIEMGYDLGRTYARLGRLREVRRVLELEGASYRTPERVDLVARTLLGMQPPGSERMMRGKRLPTVLDAEQQLAKAGERP